MTFSSSATVSGSQPPFVADVKSEQKLATRRGYEKRKNWNKRRFPNQIPAIEIEAGRGMSNFQKFAFQDPLLAHLETSKKTVKKPV